MNELLILLQQFISVLSRQIVLYQELLPILDAEEDSISRFDMALFEKIMIEKDQQVKRAHAIDDQRVKALKRICYMIAFDTRSQAVSLKTFLIAFDTYLNNVEKLVEKNIYESLCKYQEKLKDVAIEYETLFKNLNPRIYRNKIILKKVLDNFSRSILLMQNTADLSLRYDALGKSQQGSHAQEAVSSLHVKA
ncbi:MAG: flagellar protein FlgN [Silvanigrellaceae bacterium]|nr:flagellar protein FlgN [Silvanigrellaceae bacterium]